MGEIDRLVGLVPQWQGLDPVIEPIALGITNRNYRVTLTNGRSYVVRLPGERTELLGIDRAAEAEMARRAALLGIAPRVFGELPTVGTLITEFVPGEHSAFTADRLATVVALLRSLHTSGPILNAFPIFRIIERHAVDAAANGGVVPQAYHSLRSSVARIERVFVGEELVPCHNDLLPANVLFHESRSYLLDFEYAGMNNLWFDLGNLSVNSAFTAQDDDRLLAAYFGDVTPWHRARLQLMKIVSEYREGMWGVVQAAISTLEANFSTYGDDRLANCLRLIQNPDFDVWLSVAATNPPPAPPAPPTPPTPLLPPLSSPPLPPPSSPPLPPPPTWTPPSSSLEPPLSSPPLPPPPTWTPPSASLEPSHDVRPLPLPWDPPTPHPWGQPLPPPKRPDRSASSRSLFGRGFLVGLLTAAVGLLGFLAVSRPDAGTATAPLVTVAVPTTSGAQSPLTSSGSQPVTGSAAPPSGDGPWVIGNYPWYERDEVTPAEFPYEKVTHVAIGNATLTSPTRCCIAPTEDQPEEWAAFETAVIARAHSAGRKVLLQLGGAGGNQHDVWGKATKTDAAATAIGAQIADFGRRSGYDGIEIDWEENVDLTRVAVVAAEIRRLWPDAVLTVDVLAIQDTFAWAPALATSVDRITAMTYVSIGNWGGWDGPWHQGPMFENLDHSLNDNHPYSVDRTVRALLATGVPAARISIGLGLFGTGYGDENHRGGCPTSPMGWADERGYWLADHDLTLASIDKIYEPFMDLHRDPVALTPWLSAPEPGAGGSVGITGAWPPKLCYISFEDEQSAGVKAQYIRQLGLGGLTLWAVPQDHRADGGFPVIDSVVKGLHK